MSLLKRVIFIIGDLIGLNWLFRKINAGKVRVLMYHGVTSQTPPAFCWTVLAKDKFTWQMEHLKRLYDVRPASEVLTGDRPLTGSDRGVTVITFDDGLENNFTEAWPILSELGLTAICFVLPGLSQRGEQIWADDLFEFFLDQPAGDLDLSGHGLGVVRLAPEKEHRAGVIAGLLEKLKAWPAKKRAELIEHLMPERNHSREKGSGLFRLMSVDQMSQMAASREFEIGIHTDTHPIMSALTPEEQEREITDAIGNLKLGEIRFVPVFAYPNGRPQDFNEATVAALKKLRLRAAVTTVDALWDSAEDRYLVPRIGIGSDATSWEFKARMSGFYYYLAALGGRN
jgi:peptidoglycan/xylan/chitin deacetylase (PgdA/CDA1 family)